jgi:hypothetical protein
MQQMKGSGEMTKLRRREPGRRRSRDLHGAGADRRGRRRRAHLGTGGTTERHAIANVGCRVVLLGGTEGTEEPRLTALERPSSIPRPPGEPLRGLSWKRWTRPVARARGRTVEGGERKPVRIVASRPGYCAAVGALAYRKLRVVLGSSAYTLRFAGQCRD